MTTSVTLQTDPTTGVAPPAPAAPIDYEAQYKTLQAEFTRLKQGSTPATPVAPGADPATKPTGIPVVDPAAPVVEPKTGDAPATPEPDAASKVVDASGFNVAPFSAEFDATGDVAPASREAIAKGLEKVLGPQAREVVDNYIDGQKTRAAANTAQLHGAAGGVDGYNTMVQWAATALPPVEQAAYNAQVNSGNLHTAMFAVEALRSRFAKANGAEPVRFKGTFPGADNGDVFRSTAEMQVAMRDPKYKTDPAYRDSVKAKLGRSKL